MSILKTTDFNAGEYKLPKDCFTDLETYITKYEKKYLVLLLGSDLYDLFIADLTAGSPTVGQVPQTAPYATIFNELRFDKDGALYYGEGIKKMLIQFVYFHALRDLAYKKTLNGVVAPQQETGSSLGYNGYNLVEAYNEGVCNYNTIDIYINDNSTDFPTYNGESLCFISGI